MLKTLMDRQDDGRYAVELLDNDVVVATSTEALPLKRAVSWCDQAAIDYKLAQLRLGQHP
jgi:hypothetical protein